jgi:hypothetical protein
MIRRVPVPHLTVLAYCLDNARVLHTEFERMHDPAALERRRQRDRLEAMKLPAYEPKPLW